jgi:hypothetical protein
MCTDVSFFLSSSSWTRWSSLRKKKRERKGRDESEWNKTQSLFQGSSSSSSRVDDDEASLSTGAAVRV